MNVYLSWLLDMERVWMERGRENRSNVQSIPRVSMDVYLSWLLDMERVWMERDRENSGNSLWQIHDIVKGTVALRITFEPE